MQPRSPAYPGYSLTQAIVFAEKLHTKNRMNPIDREAASKDMGFSGVTGSSTKALADLAHYGLITKAGKGSIRLSQRALDIIYPNAEADKKTALQDAAFSPALFSALRQHFNDGMPSENALKGYLMRQQFISAVIPGIITSYLETCRLLQQANVTESHGNTAAAEPKSLDNNALWDPEGDKTAVVPVGRTPPAALPSPPVAPFEGLKLMSGERVVFVEESGPDSYIKLVAAGDFDETALEALEDYIKRQKKRLAKSAGPIGSDI